jgi:hypothetical protein
MRFLVALVKADVSEECIVSIITVKRISELIVAADVSRSLVLFTLKMGICSSGTSIDTRTTGRHIPEDSFLSSGPVFLSFLSLFCSQEISA